MSQSQRLLGLLNTDDKPDSILPGHHIDSRNVRFFGDVMQNILGNVIIPNSFLPNTGSNEGIGSFYDQVRRRIIWFNYNSGGKNGIYSLSLQTGTISKIFICFTDSATDILNFSLDYPVHSCAIVYRPQSEGDLLYWTDGRVGGGNRPRYINLDTVASLAPFTEDMINAAKNAPTRVPFVQYQDDAATNSNYLNGKLFQFATRLVYKDNFKSTLSPWTKVPLPVNGYNPDVQNDPTKNNNILIQSFVGNKDNTTIEIFGRELLNNVWGDPFLIGSFILADYGVPPNTVFNFNFYNDGVYTTDSSIFINGSQKEGVLPFSYLPDLANTLETLNGNVIIYGGITNGYDRLTRSQTNVSITSGVAAPNVPTISYTFGGLHELTIYVGATITTGAVYHVFFNYNSGAFGDASPKNITYTTPIGASQNSVGIAIAALLNGNNITATHLGNGIIRIITSTGTGTISDVNTFVSGVAGSSVAAPSWDWLSPQLFGLVYFDDRGKTNGVISFVGSTIDTTDFSVTTPAFSTSTNIPQVPYIQASINHTPPSWATCYQWVRAALTPTLLQFITNEVQSDSNFIYFCIQNLTFTKTNITGFVPSYEFKKGDRIKLFASYNSGTGFYSPYNLQLDMEILGTVERTMTSPASNGTFLKVARPTTLPSGGYAGNTYFEVYTPLARTATDQQTFFEWGERYGITTVGGNRFHDGQIQNQTLIQPALFQWFDGDIYFKGRQFYLNVGDTTTKTAFMMDENYSDYFPSAVNSNGRAWVIDVNAKQEYNPVQLSWGQAYQQDTNVNQINIFYPDDFDTIDRAKGDIIRFKVRERIMRIFQQRGCGQVGVYSKFVQDSGGSNILTTTDSIITSNNVQYYEGHYGMGQYPTNLASSTIADYFVDMVTGREIRLSGNGITDLGLVFKGQYYLPTLTLPYNKSILRSDGSIAKVMKVFDYFDNNCHTILQSGTIGSNSYGANNYSFHDNSVEAKKGFWTKKYDWNPEWAMSAEDIMYSWKDGNIYIHNSETYCNFYGVQYDAYIDMVFNGNLAEKKTWISIVEVANTKWKCPIIYTNVNSYGSQRQETNLDESEFTLLEQNPTAVFKRDINSVGGKGNGQFIKGNYIVVRLYKTNANSLYYLSEVSVKWLDSPLLPK